MDNMNPLEQFMNGLEASMHTAKKDCFKFDQERAFWGIVGHSLLLTLSFSFWALCVYCSIKFSGTGGGWYFSFTSGYAFYWVTEGITRLFSSIAMIRSLERSDTKKAVIGV